MIIVHYLSIGTQLGVAGPAPKGGAAYYVRKKRYLAYILTGFLLLIL
jgi:hypothetical protein